MEVEQNEIEIPPVDLQLEADKIDDVDESFFTKFDNDVRNSPAKQSKVSLDQLKPTFSFNLAKAEENK